jgi:predicted transcriptional regulator
MRRSKIEMYIDILKVLAHNGPLKLTHLMYKANINCSVLKEYVDFLVKQKLVEGEKISKERRVYKITPRGMKALGFFRELSGTYAPSIIIRESKYVKEEARKK